MYWFDIHVLNDLRTHACGGSMIHGPRYTLNMIVFVALVLLLCCRLCRFGSADLAFTVIFSKHIASILWYVLLLFDAKLIQYVWLSFSKAAKSTRKNNYFTIHFNIIMHYKTQKTGLQSYSLFSSCISTLCYTYDVWLKADRTHPEMYTHKGDIYHVT